MRLLMPIWVLLCCWPLAMLQARQEAALAFEEVAGSPVLGPLNALAIGPDGSLWAGTEQGLLQVAPDGSKHLFTPKNASLRDGHINCLLLDPAGGLWMGTYSKGLMHREPGGRFRHLPFADARVLLVADLAQDPAGTLWAATVGGGIYRAEGDALVPVFNLKNSKLPSNSVMSLGFFPDGTLWAGTDAGLAFFDGRKWTVLESLPGVRGLLAQSDGSWLAGGMGPDGPVLWTGHGKDWEEMPARCGPLPPLRGMAKGTGCFWMATHQGLLRLDGKGCRRFDARHGLGERGIASAAQAPDSTLWIGTADGRLLRTAKPAPPPEPPMPAVAESPLELGKPFRLGRAVFVQGTAELADSLGAALEIGLVADYWKEHPDCFLRIAGHTDSQGSPIENWKLSRDRAQRIGEWLRRLGVPADRLRIEWHGEARPVASNDTPEGRIANRRVEITVETTGKP